MFVLKRLRLNPSTASIHSLALHWCFRSTYGSTIPKSLGIRNGLFLHNHRTVLIAMSPSPRGSLNLITTTFEDLSSAIESANNGTSTDAGEIKTNFATIDDQHPKTQLRCGGLQGKPIVFFCARIALIGETLHVELNLPEPENDIKLCLTKKSWTKGRLGIERTAVITSFSNSSNSNGDEAFENNSGARNPQTAICVSKPFIRRQWVLLLPWACHQICMFSFPR